MNENQLIQQYKIIHSQDSTYGITGGAFIDECCLFIDFLKPKTVLDYGCGKGALIKELSKRYPNIEFFGYDPAIESYSELPIKKADFVINTDVLEHIPQENLSSIIAEIASISQNVFFVLHHYPAEQILPNGTNAHCTVKPKPWYYNLFDNYFNDIIELKSRNQFNTSVITFKLLPAYIFQYNSLIENSLNNKQCDECKLLLKVFHNNDIKNLLYKYKFLSFISFGKKKFHYREKIKRLKDLKNKFFGGGKPL